MSKINDGGPAFAYGNPEQGGSSGMTMRDYFATHASENDIAAHIMVDGKYPSALNPRFREDAKFRYADAMIAARDGGEK